VARGHRIRKVSPNNSTSTRSDLVFVSQVSVLSVLKVQPDKTLGRRATPAVTSGGPSVRLARFVNRELAVAVSSQAVRSSSLPSPGFQVVFVDRDAGELRQPLSSVAAYPFENAAPVRSFPSFRSQRNSTGWWWCGTNRRHVGFESWLERDHVIQLDFAPEVVGLSSQPFWLSWDDGARGRRHAPDYFARLADGGALVVDCRPRGRIKPRDAAAFAATERACRQIGWRYELAHEPDATLMANLRWRAGYRHTRCRGDDGAAAAGDLAGTPRPLMELATLLGDPLATLPVIFHLLWTSELRTNLSVLLNEYSTVSTPLDADFEVS
jgi:hypothetical protein